MAALAAVLGTLLITACGPRAHIPPVPLSILAALPAGDSGAILARQMAPLLYLQRDETFPLSRAVAVAHPTRPIVAYFLLWRDDVHGAWVPFTIPTDEEVIWVGYDSLTREPTDIWTYWHGKILHAGWRGRGQIIIDVQWGKHGSLPHGALERDLPPFQTLNAFYALSWLGLADIWLGRLTRRGPLCFCRSLGRYREFTTPLFLGPRLDVIARAEDPAPLLRQIFGAPYSEKPVWPWLEGKKKVVERM